MNEKAQVFPSSKYYFNLGVQSEVAGNLKVVWQSSDGENTSQYNTVVKLSENYGIVECDECSMFKCILIIPEGYDFANGVILFPEMIQITDAEEESVLAGEDLQIPAIENISYLKSIYPYENQSFGKVFFNEPTGFLFFIRIGNGDF